MLPEGFVSTPTPVNCAVSAAAPQGVGIQAPEPAVNLVTWLGHKHDPAKNNVYGVVRIENSTVQSNVGKVYRVRLGLPMAGMSQGAIDARSAELKAVKIAFTDATAQESIRAQLQTALSGINFNFAGKQGYTWYEPGNRDAPDGSKQKHDKQRWLSAADGALAFAGQLSFKLQNTPLMGAAAPGGLAGVPSTVPMPAPAVAVPAPVPVAAAPVVPTPPQIAPPTALPTAGADASAGML